MIHPVDMTTDDMKDCHNKNMAQFAIKIFQLRAFTSRKNQKEEEKTHKQIETDSLASHTHRIVPLKLTLYQNEYVYNI